MDFRRHPVRSIARRPSPAAPLFARPYLPLAAARHLLAHPVYFAPPAEPPPDGERLRVARLTLEYARHAGFVTAGREAAVGVGVPPAVAIGAARALQIAGFLVDPAAAGEVAMTRAYLGGPPGSTRLQQERQRFRIARPAFGKQRHVARRRLNLRDCHFERLGFIQQQTERQFLVAFLQHRTLQPLAEVPVFSVALFLPIPP